MKVEHARMAVRALLIVPVLLTAVGLVGTAVQAFELAGSPINALIAFTLVPLSCWIGWKVCTISASVRGWLGRGALGLAGLSVLASLLGSAWPALVAIPAGTSTAGLSPHADLQQVAGIGLCLSGIAFGVLAASVLWDRSPA
ncbi:MAG: hypothetical protein AAGA54_29595 [Myxococcota bacterium]